MPHEVTHQQQNYILKTADFAEDRFLETNTIQTAFVFFHYFIDIFV